MVKLKFLWISLGFMLTGAAGWIFLAGKLPVFFPVSHVSIHGEYRYLDTEELKATIHKHVQNGFWFVDVEMIKQALMSLPWIKQVSVKKVGIDGLDIEVWEHTVIGRWGERALLTEHGLILESFNKSVPMSVPIFSGSHLQARAISQKYPALLWSLSTIKTTLSKLRVTERGSWEIELENDLILLLGQRDVDERLRRFVSLFLVVGKPLFQNVERVDLRYANGIALKRKV